MAQGGGLKRLSPGQKPGDAPLLPPGLITTGGSHVVHLDKSGRPLCLKPSAKVMWHHKLASPDDVDKTLCEWCQGVRRGELEPRG